MKTWCQSQKPTIDCSFKSYWYTRELYTAKRNYSIQLTIQTAWAKKAHFYIIYDIRMHDKKGIRNSNCKMWNKQFKNRPKKRLISKFYQTKVHKIKFSKLIDIYVKYYYVLKKKDFVMFRCQVAKNVTFLQILFILVIFNKFKLNKKV